MHKLFRSSLEAPHNQELCGSHVSDVRFLTRVWWRSATWRAASVTPPARLAITDHPRGLDADPTCLPLLLNYTPAVPSKRTVPPRSWLVGHLNTASATIESSTKKHGILQRHLQPLQGVISTTQNVKRRAPPRNFSGTEHLLTKSSRGESGNQRRDVCRDLLARQQRQLQGLKILQPPAVSRAKLASTTTSTQG